MALAPASWEELEGDASFWVLYERSFPLCEREPRDVFERALRLGKGQVLRGHHAGRTVGFSAVHLLESPAAVFLVYLAVDSAVSGQGWGTALFERAWTHGRESLALRGLTPEHYLWEVEDPARSEDDAALHVRERRIRFFEGCGGSLLALPYLQPPLQGGAAVPMRLMARRPAGEMPLEVQAALARAIYLEKYGALNGLPSSTLEPLLAHARAGLEGAAPGLGRRA